jgi:hypothetical protein
LLRRLKNAHGKSLTLSLVAFHTVDHTRTITLEHIYDDFT